jgi:N-acetylmuramoyl-L-alanine amidase
VNLHKCILTNNDCYKRGRKITPKGIMVHSTGANNPNIRRYVQPDDGILGLNNNGNDWNHPNIQKCIHAFVGKLADGSIGTYQTLPWNWRGWHCGSGKKGSANNTHISFEICEDGLDDPVYFKKVYREAVELTAYLCKQYNLNPLEDGVVICHHEGYVRGIASGHIDVEHWFPKFGKTMDDFRQDVYEEMKGDDDEDMTDEKFAELMANYLKSVQKLPGSSWSESDRQWAIDNGIIKGDENGNAMWSSFITREQMAVMLHRYDQLK